MTETLRVSEIFYSLAGEGARAGEASIFIRLRGCSAKHACAKSGVVCDTEFESGAEMSLEEVHDRIFITQDSTAGLKLERHCKWIVFTGGEPLDQLTAEHLNYFKSRGFMIALETSGVKTIDEYMNAALDHITVSPKVAEHILKKNFGDLRRGGSEIAGTVYQVDELRYVRHAGQPGIPQPSLKAKYYYLSPHSDGAEINRQNLKHCIKLCLQNPTWRLSVQQHKTWSVL